MAESPLLQRGLQTILLVITIEIYRIIGEDKRHVFVDRCKLGDNVDNTKLVKLSLFIISDYFCFIKVTKVSNISRIAYLQQNTIIIVSYNLQMHSIVIL